MSINMKVGQRYYDIIKHFEGCELTAYWDTYANVWTIGYGHTGADVYEGLTITQERANELLEQDTSRFISHVNKVTNVTLKQYEFDPMVSFAYNGGEGAYNDIVDLINKGDKQGAMVIHGQYIHGDGGVVAPGLVRRRSSEKDCFLNDDLSSIGIDTSPYPDGDGGITPPDPPTPPPDGFFSVKRPFLFNKDDSLFGTRFSYLKNKFKVVKVQGNCYTIIEDGKNKKIRVNKNNLKKWVEIKPPEPPLPSGIGAKIVETAKRCIGLPYEQDPSYNYKSEPLPPYVDCSSLCQWSYWNNGIEISRVTWTQIKEGNEVSLNDLKLADLIFTNFDSQGITQHVYLYSGFRDGQHWCIESPTWGIPCRERAFPLNETGRMVARRIIK